MNPKKPISEPKKTYETPKKTLRILLRKLVTKFVTHLVTKLVTKSQYLVTKVQLLTKILFGDQKSNFGYQW